ncbi:DUF6510 family protein [Streptomyces sp. NPDC007861]|uniref:DUF6510 family protein n=1 Tax=Streptomyces sp. NPDC007861 TaxID=3154893 RepID=UPI0033D1C743
MTIPADGSPAEYAYMDGNALAGPLSEVFTVDVTTATSRCAHCGRTGPVAALRVYAHAPGLVARCEGCDEVVLRMVRGTQTLWLDLRGAVALAFPMDGA